MLVLAGAFRASPQEDVVFRSSVSLVRVDAEVQDAAGQLITDLKKDDFRVTDEGAPQAMVNFSFEEEPLDLILLFDVAGSMKGKVLEVFRAVELGFNELHRGDRVCVMDFGGFSEEIAPFSADLESINEAIVLKVPRLHFGGDWKLEEGAQDAAIRFRREPVTQRRRAVLIITDKIGSRSAAADPAIRSLWTSDAVLSALVLGGSQPTRVLEPGANPIADKTGGATIVAGAPGPAFQDSVRRLRRRYTMYYAVPAAAPGSERAIHVECLRPNSRVRARTGYVVSIK
jgi:VWFA-related protein